jgi:DNA replication protein DnaC
MSFEFYSDTEVDPTLGITPFENIHNILTKCHTFISDFEKPYAEREYKNLLIYGNTGVGKTFLANCIAREILNNAHSVVYITATELFETFSKHSFDRDNDYELDSKVEYINSCDLLIIDDLGTELSNSFTNSQLYSCINNRILKNLSVIISTNYQLNELQTTYSERIFSRFVGEYSILRLIGDDIRIKHP